MTKAKRLPATRCSSAVAGAPVFEFDGPLGKMPGSERVSLATVDFVAKAWDREAPIASATTQYGL
jgi:hypothetical protein